MKDELKKIVINALNDSSELTQDENDKAFWNFEVYADYNDQLSDDQIADILRADDPDATLTDLLNNAYQDYILETGDEITNYVTDNIAESYGDMEADEENEVHDFINDHVHYNLPIDHYLEQNVNIDILIDAGDGNYDYQLNYVYPATYGAEEIDQHAGLSLLAKLQGYNLTKLRTALEEGDVRDPHGFLESVRSEAANVTTSMNVLTILASVTLKEAIELQTLVKQARKTGYEYRPWKRPDCGYVTITKDAYCGLYDLWNGAGSDFDIELEKNMRLPIKFIASVMPDSCREFSVESIYGMPETAWKPCVKTIHHPKVSPLAIAE